MYIYTLTLKAKTQWQCKQTVIICVIAGGRGSDVLLSLTARVETAAQCPELCESQWGKLTVTLWIHLYFSVSSGFTGLFLLCCADTNTWKNTTYISIQQEVEQSSCRTSCDLNCFLSDLTVAPQPASLVSWSLLLVVLRERERDGIIYSSLLYVCWCSVCLFLCVCKLNIYSFTATQRPRGGRGQRPELTETAA